MQTTPFLREKISSNPNYDPSFDDILSTPPPYAHPDEYIPPKNVQDQFDWKVVKVKRLF
jgi:hypothetical protein